MSPAEHMPQMHLESRSRGVWLGLGSNERSLLYIYHAEIIFNEQQMLSECYQALKFSLRLLVVPIIIVFFFAAQEGNVTVTTRDDIRTGRDGLADERPNSNDENQRLGRESDKVPPVSQNQARESGKGATLMSLCEMKWSFENSAVVWWSGVDGKHKKASEDHRSALVDHNNEECWKSTGLRYRFTVKKLLSYRKLGPSACVGATLTVEYVKTRHTEKWGASNYLHVVSCGIEFELVYLADHVVRIINAEIERAAVNRTSAEGMRAEGRHTIGSSALDWEEFQITADSERGTPDFLGFVSILLEIVELSQRQITCTELRAPIRHYTDTGGDKPEESKRRLMRADGKRRGRSYSS
ncbi:hypothetical protein C8R44DRAFT_745666 [Mycena epipterygia]|nr:hypothetical protein C8R44DRAFT_745666 [Mycena epipterygia]